MGRRSSGAASPCSTSCGKGFKDIEHLTDPTADEVRVGGTERVAAAAVFHASGLPLPRLTVVAAGSVALRNALLELNRFLTIATRFSLVLPHPCRTLKALRVKLPAPLQPIGVVTLQNHTLSPPAQMFIECVRELTRPLAQRV